MALKARIFKPTKNAMQSGRKGTRHWRLEFAPECQRYIEPLMGWTGSRDTNAQVTIDFDDKEGAIAFCEANNIDYTVFEPKQRKLHLKAYAENFSYSRVRG
ncbi:ETC complex I subunit [Sneathiella sp.]|uniref:ETC complex I subunit n=1 Tax=Sneathiella sp. TaxID=1964365 RepID=UPI003567EDD5